MSKKSIAALLGIGLVSIGLLYQFWGREFIAQDRCLDAGGAYQQATQSCDHSMDDIAYDAFDGVTYYGVVMVNPSAWRSLVTVMAIGCLLMGM